MSKNHWQFYGRDYEIQIDNQLITTMNEKQNYGLCDQLTVKGQENTPRTATFSFIPPEQIFDLNAYQGKTVNIFFRGESGWTQIFAGFVDSPALDFKARKITLTCTDERANRIIQLPASFVQQIGSYDENVFGTVQDQSDELNKRLETIPASFDFDRYGNPAVTQWLAAATPHFTFNSIDIKQDSNPRVIPTNRDKTINTINMTVKYSYQRLHQQCINFNWPGFSDFKRDWYDQGRPTFPTRAQINSAATSSSWVLINPTLGGNFVSLWPAGGYNGIVWQPNQVINQYKQATQLAGYEKDSTGNFVTVAGQTVPIYKPQVDADGKPVMTVVATTIIDTASALCRGVNFSSAIRFSQNVIEQYNISVQAPQSVAKFGVINSQLNVSITDPFDATDWDQSKVATNIAENFYMDQTANRSQLNSALITLYNKARHDILEVHRDISVIFQTKLVQPDVDLIHTVQLNVSDPKSNTSHISVKGKVKAVSHLIDFNKETAYSEITLLLSKADGSETDDNLAISTPIQDPSYIGSPQTIILGTHLGEDPSTPQAATWNGWIANCDKKNTLNNGVFRTTYNEMFIVDYPPIPDNIRNEITYTSNTSLNIAIPNDYLETST